MVATSFDSNNLVEIVKAGITMPIVWIKILRQVIALESSVSWGLES